MRLWCWPLKLHRTAAFSVVAVSSLSSVAETLDTDDDASSIGPSRYLEQSVAAVGAADDDDAEVDESMDIPEERQVQTLVQQMWVFDSRGRD